MDEESIDGDSAKCHSNYNPKESNLSPIEEP